MRIQILFSTIVQANRLASGSPLSPPTTLDACIWTFYFSWGRCGGLSPGGELASKLGASVWPALFQSFLTQEHEARMTTQLAQRPT